MNKYALIIPMIAVTVLWLIPAAEQVEIVVVPPRGQNSERNAYIAKIAQTIVMACLNTPVFPSVAMVMAIYETANGTNDLSRSANNHFGIKATNWNGAVYEAFDDCGATKCKFRAYNSFSESVFDFVVLLRSTSRYASAMQKNSPQAQIEAIMAAGYASTAYGSVAKKIIEDYNLEVLDKYV